MASSSNPPKSSTRTQGHSVRRSAPSKNKKNKKRIQQHDAYEYASSTNISNFVTVKLSGDSNYHLWKTQILCLVEAHDIGGLLQKKWDGPVEKQCDSLLKGWIFGSVSEDVLRIVVDLDTAKDVWKKLKSCFDYPVSSQQGLAPRKGDTKTERKGKNVVLSKTIKDKGTSSVESEAKKEEATQIDTKDDEHAIKGTTLVRMSEVQAHTEIKNQDTDPAESKVKGEDSTKDSAPAKVDEKIVAAVVELRSALDNGDWYEVYYLLEKHKDLIKEKVDNDGNTVLHIAVGIGHYDVIKRILRQLGDNDLTEIKNSDGSTVLHIAAIIGDTDAAKLLVKRNKKLLDIKDTQGRTALDRAYQNMHLNTIAYLLEAAEDHEKNREGANFDPKRMKDANVDRADVDGTGKTKSSLLPRGQIGVKLLVNAISAKQYYFAFKLIEKKPHYAVSKDHVLMALARTFPSRLDYGESLIYPSNLDNIRDLIVTRSTTLFGVFVDVFSFIKESTRSALRCDGECDARGLILAVVVAIGYWIYSSILLLLLMFYFTFSMLYTLFWKVALAARVVPLINNIEHKKKEYKEAKMVLKLVCKKIKETRGESSRDLYTGPILEAACQDAFEVVDEILSRWPEAIRCKDKNGYDIIQLATIYRSEKIYNLIHTIGDRKIIYRTMEDSSKNNMLHLAGRLAPSNKLKLRTGAALQLQRELQWRQEVEKLVFPAYVTKENIFMQTPEMVFTKEHENLVKEGESWIKTVAESCSITAALITTIVFAAAITVPGGSGQETGVPVFRKEIVFDIFALSDAISLFSSATALLVFLSILTARFAEQDFLVSLPRRLIIGLCTLLVSTTAMMVAFGATLFLVFYHHQLWMLGPICGLALVPIAFFFILQFPLILDLFRSTYISKFGKSKYHNSKFNRNDIRAFFG